MKLNPVVTTAQPGWSIVFWDMGTGKPYFSPIVAWGTASEEDDTDTEPVAIWADSDGPHWDIYGEDNVLGFCAPGDESNPKWAAEATSVFKRWKTKDAAR